MRIGHFEVHQRQFHLSVFRMEILGRFDARRPVPIRIAVLFQVHVCETAYVVHTDHLHRKVAEKVHDVHRSRVHVSGIAPTL